MKISHKIVIGFAAPALLAGLLSHIYMAKCRETGREQERLFLSVAAPLSELEQSKGEVAGTTVHNGYGLRPTGDAARRKFSQARGRFDSFMRMVEYMQYGFAVILLLLAVYTLKAVLIPIANMAIAARRLHEGHLGVMVPVRANDELGALAEAFNSMSAKLKEREGRLKRANMELEEALKNVKTLYGLLPICASCKKIRDDKGYWQKVENYFYEHSDIKFTHGICPDCVKTLYPEFAE